MLSVLQTVNSSLRQDLNAQNQAIYLPAISRTWARFVHSGSFTGKLPFAPAALNFLDPANERFRYPFALYSVGQQSSTNANAAPDIVSTRSRADTLVLGDSGGYQVSTTPGYFKPSMVLDNMRWMERMTDYSMVLDFPTGGIKSGAMAEHVERLTDEGHDLAALNANNRLGLDYNACLLQTQLNNDDFVANRTPGATKFLNVLQGRSEKESKTWYEMVKHYPFEGWAFAGHHQDEMSLLLARLIDMRDDGLLASADWVHVLGVSVLPIGVVLTQIQRTIRELYNPEFQFSFDTSSAFLSGAFQTIYRGGSLDELGWSTHTMLPSKWDRSLEHRNLGELLEQSLEGSEERRRIVARTLVSRSCSLGDLRDPATGLMSNDGYALLTHHNVEAFIDMHELAHDTFFRAPDGSMGYLVPTNVRLIAVLADRILRMPKAEACAEIKAHKYSLDMLRDRKR